MKAIWNEKIIAQSESTIVIEGNHYFPPDSIKEEYFKNSNTTTHCAWKGEASYKSIEVDGKLNPDSAWYYPEPKGAASKIKGYFAFWKGIKVEQ